MVSNPLDVLNALERLVRDAAAGASAGGSGRWEEVERAWVLFPPSEAGEPRGVVHFCGGAFVGASPQLTYRLFLETLSAKTGCVIVATPYVTSFDHLRVADEAQFTFDRASRALAQRLPPNLPVWGMGHSMGALAQCLISSRYAVARAGNVLLSACTFARAHARRGSLTRTHMAQASTTSRPRTPFRCSFPSCRR